MPNLVKQDERTLFNFCSLLPWR